MKKKVLALVLLMIISLTGCLEDEIDKPIREDILAALTDDGIIESDWEFVDYKGEEDSILPFGDIFAYNYVYIDESDKYYVINIDTLSYEDDYDYYNIFMEGGQIYYKIEISQCDITTEVHEYDKGGSWTEMNIFTSDYEPFGYYMLHYEDFLFGIGKGDLIIEELIYEDE